MADDLKDTILSIFEASLDAQLRAVRRLRQAPEPSAQGPRRKGMSQVDMAYDILKRTRSPLHVSVIIERIEQAFAVSVDRESLVSALSKKGRPPRPLLTSRKKYLRAAPGGQVNGPPAPAPASLPRPHRGLAHRLYSTPPAAPGSASGAGRPLVLGRATLSRILWTNGREQCSWSADYFLHSRAGGTLRSCLRRCSKRHCAIVPAASSAWRWMTPGCAKPDAPSPRPLTIATPSRRPSILI